MSIVLKILDALENVLVYLLVVLLMLIFVFMGKFPDDGSCL
jgi:hypothetical protein